VRRRVGLTGGIGSGKSEVARVFAACGALVIDADLLAREALAPGSAGLARIAERFPGTLTRAAGADVPALDRAELAAIVFADAEARAFVNGVVHPIVRARSAALEAAAAAGQIVVHDVPLLFEAGYEAGFDATVLVCAPRDERIERVRARSGFAAEETERRMAAQIDPADARTRATYVIENDGTLEALAARARSVFAELGGD